MKKELTASYIGDSKDYHVFLIDGGHGFMGNIYAFKNEPVVDILTIRLRVMGKAKRKAS